MATSISGGAGSGSGAGGSGGHMLSSQELKAIDEIIARDIDLIDITCHGEIGAHGAVNSPPAPSPTIAPTGAADTHPPPPEIKQEQDTLVSGAGNAAAVAAMAAMAAGKPYVNIVEQPQTKGIRFRYKCEGRSAGSIPGMRSTPDNKSFPAILIHNYVGAAAVVVSCVTVDVPHKPHPHRLVGKDCKEGVCTLKVKDASMPIVFPGIGVQCVKKKEIAESLDERAKIKVDPFSTGFVHGKNLDLKGVRLCFQVFLNGASVGQPDQQFVPLQPIISEAINDRHTNDLTICKLSSSSSSVAGNKDVILLCEKVNKDDIEIRFYELDARTGEETWSDFGRFRPDAVHRQVAICFEVPPYKNTLLTEPVQTWIELRKPSDKSASDPIRFIYHPIDHDDERLDAKRRKPLDVERYLLQQQQAGAGMGMAQSPSDISSRKHLQGKRRVQSSSSTYTDDGASSVYSPLQQFPPVGSPSGSHASSVSYEYSMLSPAGAVYQQPPYQPMDLPMLDTTPTSAPQATIQAAPLSMHQHDTATTTAAIATTADSDYPYVQSPSFKAIYDDISFAEDDQAQNSDFFEALTSLQRVVDD